MGLTLLRFHLRAGARVAVRTMVPLAMALTAVVVLYGSPAALLGAVAALLFSPGPSVGAAVAAAGLAYAVSRSTAPRLTLGLAGWMRHLPASGPAHRRAATAGLVAVLGPMLVVVLAGGLAVVSEQPDTTMSRLAGLPLLAWGAALAALSGGWPRPLAVGAAISAWAGTWWGPLLSAAMLTAAEASAGAVTAAAGWSGGRRGSALLRRAGARAAGEVFWTTVGRRALGARVVVAWLTSLVAMGPTLLFLRNNTLTAGQEEAAARLGSLAAAVLAIAVLAETLVKWRPPWPWARSLPWSAQRRVALDGLLLGLAALPSVAGALAVPLVIPSLFATLPWLALRGAAEVRRAPGHQGGTSLLLLEGGLAAGLVALQPWVAWALLAATPVALWLGAERERRQEISRWHELHHVAAGDPLSWSDR